MVLPIKNFLTALAVAIADQFNNRTLRKETGFMCKIVALKLNGVRSIARNKKMFVVKTEVFKRMMDKD
ncbi:hypothetical protein [Microseira wollei]|uniref:Transposase n=1 Tax=Microseira wollei NIES-4236 TaxID=2530354 RepID=A0AAV3X9S2_9CYAN|nr:hypothetical protein [Microseira wollei]GET38913.1 hypothetical protein MiSe_36730 [Microseira wollei NIES-4236]